MKSRRPKTPEGKTRSSRNALKHGMRAEKHLVLPGEDVAEFADLEATLIAELAPVGALQTVLARRFAIAAWRLARADRIEAELFAERGYGAAGPGLALSRDGNGTRSFETLLRYRGAAIAEFWCALRTLKALQAEQAATSMGASAPHPEIARRPAPNEPERCAERRLAYALPDQPPFGHALHDPVALAPCGAEPIEPDRAAFILAHQADPAIERTRAGAPRRCESGRKPRGLDLPPPSPCDTVTAQADESMICSNRRAKAARPSPLSCGKPCARTDGVAPL